MIPTTLYRATSAKASVNARLAAVSRSSSTETSVFGRVVASRETRPLGAPRESGVASRKTERADKIETGAPRTPSLSKIFASGGLTLKQAQRLMDEAAREPLVDDARVSYQRPAIALQHFAAAVLCGTVALIAATFFTLLLN